MSRWLVSSAPLLAGKKPYAIFDTATFETAYPAPCRQKAVRLSRYNNL
jgi:hypothetical protein